MRLQYLSRKGMKLMASNLPLFQEGDYVWLARAGVFGEQPPKGAMLSILNFFETDEDSLELGPAGKYACCWWENKHVYASLEKLEKICIGQWVKFELRKITYTGQISNLEYGIKITHLKPCFHEHRAIQFPIGPFISLINEKEAAMHNNLPPGCSDSDIPGCTPEDHLIDKAIENKWCEACKHYLEPTQRWSPCGSCHSRSLKKMQFDQEEDEALIGERLEAAAAAREDGHKDE